MVTKADRFEFKDEGKVSWNPKKVSTGFPVGGEGDTRWGRATGDAWPPLPMALPMQTVHARSSAVAIMSLQHHFESLRMCTSPPPM